MALTSTNQLHDQELKIEQQKTEAALQKANMLESLMIASMQEPDMDSAAYRDKKINEKYQRINNPSRPTEGQLLGESGQYLKDPETEVDTSQPLESRMFDIDPKKHKTQQKQKKIRGIAEEGSTEGERQAGRGKLKDQTQLPNFLKTVLDSKPNPLDVLKILQLLPALTGGGLGQMAGVNYGPPTERDKWLQLYQGPGGTLRHLDPDMRKLILNRGVLKTDASNNIRSLQSSGHQTVLDDNNPGRLKIIKQFKPPRA
jgi:hypothetical protein